MKSLVFRKMHGLGNDFVVIDCRDGSPVLDESEIVRIADRTHGIGCDQVVHLQQPKSSAADIRLDMYNSDGSLVQACGNATRCAAHLWMQENGAEECMLETVKGVLHCRLICPDTVEADMGMPRWNWVEIPLLEERETTLELEPLVSGFPAPAAVNIGNPHCVFFVDDLDAVDVEKIGPVVEHHKLFPDRTNVEFAQVLAPDRIRVRVWERGAGLTQACGSGACAVLVTAVGRGLANRKAEIILDGGSLSIEWNEEDNHILMTGPVAYVFDGTFRF